MLSIRLIALGLGAAVVLSACAAPLDRRAGAGASAPLATCGRAGAETPGSGAWQPAALRCEP